MRLIRRLIARFRRAPQPRVIGRITSITESADGLHITGELDAEAREGRHGQPPVLLPEGWRDHAPGGWIKPGDWTDTGRLAPPLSDEQHAELVRHITKRYSQPPDIRRR